MSEPFLITEQKSVTVQAGGVPASKSDAMAPASYGARLAWERQRAGLGVTDVAASLRLHPNQVRAIEQEDLTRLPELAYVRGFIRSYARLVKIDPAPILVDLNAKLAPAPVADASATASYAVMQGAARERMSGLVIGFALIGLIVLGVLGWQTTLRDAQVQPPASPTPAAAVVTTPTPVAGNLTSTPASEATTPSAAAAEPFPPTDSQPAAGSNADAVAPVLMLRFDGRSWAEVTDATGKILLSQLSSVGAEHALDGELPLTVVVGNANKTSVEIRGEAFNLLPFTRNNVARFTVQ